MYIYSGTEFLSYLSWKCYEYHESSASLRHVNFSFTSSFWLLCAYVCVLFFLLMLLVFLLLLSFVPSIVTSYIPHAALYKTSLLQAANPHKNLLSRSLSRSLILTSGCERPFAHTHSPITSNLVSHFFCWYSRS